MLYVIDRNRLEVMTEEDFCWFYKIERPYDEWRAAGETLPTVIEFTDKENAREFIEDQFIGDMIDEETRDEMLEALN